MNTPEIRFKGFKDEWEQRKLGECFSERLESMPDGELISVTINDGIKKFSELGRHDSSNEDKSKYKKVCVGDIAYNSMRMWQGASGYSPYEGIVSPAYTVLRPNNEFVDSKCIAYLFKKPEIIRTFQVNSQGITSDNWNLKYPALSQISIYISKDVKEQVKIASFLESIDNLITLNQHKLDTLRNYKKAMLVKMFPQNGQKVPEIRFKGFSGDWETKELKDIFQYLQNNTFSRAELSNESGYSINIHYGDVLIHYGECTNISAIPMQYIKSREIVEKYKKSWLQNGDVIMADTAEDETTGKCTEIQGVLEIPVISGLHTIPLRPIIPFAEGYLGYFMNSDSYHDQLLTLMHGTKVVSVSKNDIRETNIIYPHDFMEQRKIGHFFSSLDNLIVEHEKKIIHLKDLKQAMLNKMFVREGA